MMQDVHVLNEIQDCHGNKCKMETSAVLHLEYNFIWCWNLETSESRSDVSGKVWNL